MTDKKLEELLISPTDETVRMRVGNEGKTIEVKVVPIGQPIILPGCRRAGEPVYIVYEILRNAPKNADAYSYGNSKTLKIQIEKDNNDSEYTDDSISHSIRSSFTPVQYYKILEYMKTKK